MKLITAFPLLLLSFCSCESRKTGTAGDSAGSTVIAPAAAKDRFPTGQVLQLGCKSDSTNRYALYLPKNYDGKKQLPLLLFFDPHAAGALPLEKYKSLSEQYGIILAGSNVSKNGMDFNRVANSAAGQLADLQSRLQVDNRMLLLCGFSGGARVAGMYALNQGGIAGVIGCSASLPGNSAGLPFFYTGLAGLSDMNYLEMRTQHQLMDSLKTPHAFLLFPGKHEWAPVQTMDKALLFQLAQLMKQKSIPADPALLKKFADNILQQSDSLAKNRGLLFAVDLLQDAAVVLEGNNAAEALLKKSEELKKNPELQRERAVYKKLLLDEQYLQNEFAGAISTQPLSWFESNFSRIDTSGTNKSNPVYYMHKRVWAYLSLVAYSYCNQAFQQGNPPVIGHYVDFYKTVDPQNSEWAYMKAKQLMMTGDKDNALAALETCISLGFKDRARLEQEAGFKPLFTEKRFQDILQKAGQ